jgi:hypothetical protein
VENSTPVVYGNKTAEHPFTRAFENGILATPQSRRCNHPTGFEYVTSNDVSGHRLSRSVPRFYRGQGTNMSLQATVTNALVRSSRNTGGLSIWNTVAGNQR